MKVILDEGVPFSVKLALSFMSSNTDDLTSSAVKASLSQDWDTAVDLNTHILQLDPRNIAALNRLGKAYEEIGEVAKAKKTYLKVIDIDKFNSIATNNLSRLKLFSKTKPATRPSGLTTITRFSFIEEPGKTKTVFLTKLGPHQVLSTLRISQPVFLKVSRRRLCVSTQGGKFIGYLPDDLSLHLIKLIKLGNKYESAIKSLQKTKVEIFIRETKKSARLKGLPSFPSRDTNQYYQFLPSEPIAETPLEMNDQDDSEY